MLRPSSSRVASLLSIVSITVLGDFVPGQVGMSGSSGPLRAKRYLVFPRPGSYTPTKVQLILGIGLPMEVDVSTIMGYVVKFNYNLPYNASTLTDPYVRHERSPVEGPGSSFQPREGPEEFMSRWDIYKTLERTIGLFQPGRPCLLKAVCEAADVPFNGNHGVLGELLQVLLTPSSTSDGQENVDDQEYRAAEILGREHPGQCGRIFSDCDSSLLEYFSEVF